MQINPVLTEELTTEELNDTETFILEAWLREADEYLAWCEDNDEHDHVDAVLGAREAIANEISDR